MYGAFAKVYDRLMESVDYAGWSRHYRELLTECGAPGSGRVIECACGTGSLTIPLCQSGYKITGVDLSEEMLARAMDKARAAGCMIPFVRQDMTKLTAPRRVDAVLCTCDGLNYLTEPEAVRTFFRAAWTALKPGGVLAFDLSTPEKLSGTLGNQTIVSTEDHIPYIWQNQWDEKTACVQMELSIFEKQPGGLYRRLEEYQVQRAHSREELKGWLEETGFSEVRFLGRMRKTPPRAGDERWHVTARKISCG